MFVQNGLNANQVTITAGCDEGTMTGDRRYSVSKSHLVSMLDAKLHTGELRFAKELREAPAMVSELKDFRRHVSEAGHYSFEARPRRPGPRRGHCSLASRQEETRLRQALESAKGGAGLRQVKGGAVR